MPYECIPGKRNQSLAILVTGEQECQDIIAVFNRAFNCWADAPAALKELADKVTNMGQVQQDYYAQTGKQRPE